VTPFYPAFLDVRGRRCVVFGGDSEAREKILRLLRSQAAVAVISPSVPDDVASLATDGQIEWRRRAYCPGDLRGAFLAIAAPDVRSTNGALWDEAEREGVLLNAMDDAAHCHFIAPAIHEQGAIMVAVSTGGKAPALSVRLRDWIATTIGAEHAMLVDLLGELRPEVRRRLPDLDARRALWYRMADSEAIEYLQSGDVTGARAHLLELLSLAHQEAITETVSVEGGGDA
jgi:siroheme synthase-like protein